MGIAWILAGLSIFIWLLLVYAGTFLAGVIIVFGMLFFFAGVVTGTVQALVGPRLSQKATSVMRWQAWATTLGVLFALAAWPLVALLTNNWYLLILLALVIFQAVLHSRIQVECDRMVRIADA